MEARKRLFLGLVSLTIVLSGLLLLYLGQLLFSGGDSILAEIMVFITTIVIIGLMAMFTLGLIGIILTIINAKNYPFLDKWISLTLNLFYPIVMFLGRLFKITKDRIQQSFVEVNNQLVKVKIKDLKGKISSNKILILLPHCLQDSQCPHRINLEINNCRRCGKCPIDGLLNLSEDYGVPVRIATGGTLARKVVKEIRPKAIIAVACERDLTSGILDTNPLPVLGIVNQRPQGPCFDTQVDLSEVENAIIYLTKGGDEPCSFSIQGSFYS
ncbi:DUF116 domain-containing protein [Natranaerobius thermophilus]|uniref:DUF116 domain-containing protein n=1 Tax=Natranaerobius thermophilus (strain ATCC BAA-1301 / DSM 18059 / JW/NM-WN-LF) TaxID=457570 RepID=B2A2K3_NATTJ|nr:DUF116 domain-containing protein [Natranaerobius thermophilus]ACB84918.1 protein of unknown function DUF116 [Natranaerobius thermophilus JW/NM-WN-LF]